MDADLDTLATTLYVRIGDLLIAHPEMLTVYRPGSKRLQMSDAELITLAVMGQVFQLGSERRVVRYAHRHWAGYFPHVPQQSGYNKRLRRLAGLMLWVQRRLAEDTDQWHDDVWLADSTPVEAGRSRETVHRSDLAGFAQYGYCASQSRWFWGFRLHLLCTPGGLSVGFALTGVKADERDVLLAVVDGQLARPGQTIMADKGYTSGPFDTALAGAGVPVIRPARKDEAPRPGAASSSHCARSSNRSTRPSRANSCWNA
ncbi:MAG: IS982 family transposase, partial [Propionibacteriaceae bacterium]|nr:IS982 family transposase [Propionibacteriaceae bacterium]